MQLKIKLLVILMLLSIFTAGCWNRRELNDLAITLAMGIDVTEDEKFLVTVQVVNPEEVLNYKGSGSTPVTIYQATGETIFEAVRNITKISPRGVYPSHLRILLFGETLAKKGIGQSLDLISRDWELRSDFYIAIARGMRAEEILKISTTLEKIPANNLFNTLEVSSDLLSSTSSFTLDELVSNMVSEGKEPVLTGIFTKVKGDYETAYSIKNIQIIDSPARIYFDYLAVFNKDKLVGWLDDKESRSYNAITNKVKGTVINISCPGEGKAVLQLIKSKAKVKGKVNKGKPEVSIEFQREYNIGEVECLLDLTKPETIEELEKIEKKRFKSMIENSIRNVQKNYRADIYGFGEAIYRKDPQAWKRLKRNWDNEFENLPVSVKADIKIQGLGTINNSFKNSIK